MGGGWPGGGLLDVLLGRLVRGRQVSVKPVAGAGTSPRSSQEVDLAASPSRPRNGGLETAPIARALRVIVGAMRDEPRVTLGHVLMAVVAGALLVLLTLATGPCRWHD